MSFRLDNVPVPGGEEGRYEMTVAEYKFSLLTVSDGEGPDDALDNYLKDGGKVFRTIKLPTTEYTNRRSRIEPLSQGGRKQCLSLALQRIMSYLMPRSIFGSYIGFAPDVSHSFDADRNVGDKRSAAVRAFGWHPMRARFAVALPGDKVYFRSLGTGAWESLVLTHQLQRNVNCMQYAPTGDKLAVGCDHGICLWTFVVGANLTAWMQFLPSPDTRTRVVEWSPCGRYIVSCAFDSKSFTVWDVAKGHKGGVPFTMLAVVTRLKWSVNGDSLFVGTRARWFSIFRTIDWTSKTFKNIGVSNACWSLNSQVLLLANSEKPIINVINLSPAVKTLKNRMVIDLERDPKAPMGVGGIGHDIEWSPTSERLAVSFKESNTDLIAVFGTSWGTLPSFQPLGYIRGPPSRFPKGKNMPIHMKFRPNCKGGALLAVCWAEGQISIYPLLFQSTTRVK